MGKKKSKKINPDRVTRTMKQLYANQANAIRTKIARRQVWAEEWSEKIKQIEDDMKTTEIAESQAIADLKLQLATTQRLQTETSSTICLIQDEIEENHLKYKHEIVRLEIEKTKAVRETTAEVSMLDKKEQDIRFFMGNETEMYAGLTQRREKMISMESEHQQELLKIQQSRVQRTERLTTAIDRKMQIFKEGLRKSMKMDDPVYVGNAHLQEWELYICGQILDLGRKIPETRKRIQELRLERKECFRNLGLKVLDGGEKLSEKLEEQKMELKLRTSVGSQTEEFDMGFQPIEEISGNRIKAVLKGIKKLITEARSLVLIPRGALPEEAKLNDEEVQLRYMHRRDFIIKRRQYILELIQEIIQHGKSDASLFEPSTTPKPASPKTTPKEPETPMTPSTSTSPSLPTTPTSTHGEDSNDIISLYSLNWDSPIEE